MIGPSQDIVLGNYYITCLMPGEKGEGMVFRDTFEAITAYEMGKVGVHAKVKVGLPKGKTDHRAIKASKSLSGRYRNDAGTMPFQ